MASYGPPDLLASVSTCTLVAKSLLAGSHPLLNTALESILKERIGRVKGGILGVWLPAWLLDGRC